MIIHLCTHTGRGDRGSTVVKLLCYKPECRWFDPSWCPSNPTMTLGVESTSNRNEYRQHFLGGKGGRCIRLTTYHHPVPLS